jgi:hypothetical protein
VEEPAIVYPLVGAGATEYVAAEALAVLAAVVHTVPDVNALDGAVAGDVIVCSAGLERLTSPGARLAQLGASYSVPEPPAVCGQKLVIAVTPPWASDGSAPSPLT